MDADEKPLVPDERILSGIFPTIPDISDRSTDIVSNSFDVCTFRLTFDVEPYPGWPTDLVIRLETATDKLRAVAKVQSLAHRQALTVVPATLETGTVDDAQGRQIAFSITPFLAGTVTLEKVWNDLHESNQQALMDSVFEAIKSFQELRIQEDISSLRLQDPADSDIPSKVLFGGPDTGYHESLKPLLEAFVHLGAVKRSICQVVDTADGIAIRSADDGEVELTSADLDELARSAVLCHNDLEPRNILVKRKPQSEEGDDGSSSGWYELAAIIDWELASILPFAYESGLKDALLGSSNMLFSWYALFKEKTAGLVPRGTAHEKLIVALRIIAQSNAKATPRNVGVRVQKRWLARERLNISADVRQGWVREEGAGDVPPFTKADHDTLETEVLTELGYI